MFTQFVREAYVALHDLGIGEEGRCDWAMLPAEQERAVQRQVDGEHEVYPASRPGVRGRPPKFLATRQAGCCLQTAKIRV